MVVNIRLIGSLRTASKKNEFALRLKRGTPLREAIAKIVEKQPRLGRALIDPELGDPTTNALILVNGKDISVLDGLETKLKDGDELVIIPVVHGG